MIFMRKIHINNRIWKYHIGKQNVIIESPLGYKHIVPFNKLMDMNWTDIERAKWKRYFIIKPSDIKKHIIFDIIIKYGELI
jgi:hypothetical protein